MALFDGFLLLDGSTWLVLLLKAAVILAAAWMLTRLSWRASAAIRHGIWSIALLASLSLPLTSGWLPTITVHLPEQLHFSALEAPVQPIAAGAEEMPAETPVLETSAEEPRGLAVLWEGESGPERSLPVWRSIRWSGVFMAMLLGGAALRLLWLALLYARTRRLTRATIGATDEGCVQLAGELAADLGIRRRIRVLEASHVSMPLAWGLLRPIVVLPDGAAEWPEERLRVVLLHELAHIRRWDYLTSLLAEIACAVYWPLPLVWVARRRLRIEQEQACDDRVLTMGTTNVAYAEHLLAIARAFYGHRWELGMAATMAKEISLKHRIRAILDERTDRRPLLSGTGILAGLALVAFFLPVAALRGGPPLPDNTLVDGLNQHLVDPRPDDRTVMPLELDDAPAALVSLWVEAEAGSALGRAGLREDLDASGAGYVVLEEARRRGAGGEGGEIRFTVDLPAAGDYVVWGRLATARRGSSSLEATVGPGAPVRWEISGEGSDRIREWTWVPLPAAGDSGAQREPARFRLDAGEQTLSFSSVENDVRLDRILVTTDLAYVPTGRGSAAAGFRASYRLIEAERAQLSGRFRTATNSRASGGEYLVFRSERRGEAEAVATFVFDVEDAGRYMIWGRVSAPDEDSNSFFASLDGGPEVIWDAPSREVGRSARAWTWDPISARELNGRTVDPLTYDLAPGRHTLTIRAREDGARLDAILLTNDLVHRPQGIWPASLPARPTRITLEAESAAVSPPLTVQMDPAAAGGQFVQVPNDVRGNRPGAAGSMRLPFNIRESGLYTLWGRTIARTTDENSFWVRVNGGEWIRWNGIPISDNWSWSAVKDADEENRLFQFRLDPGEHTLEIAGREGGARLDQVLITNDPLFRPGGTL